ncbi:serine hydrolase domain-containing protein [Paracoccus laeviglucosivorans]|uniref:CubicO group peptidase, beta-lactamase class C family n=1 Tax=Paracoccus laeviglucosivorans TaxID=1197861 RepID=A0A521DRF4_9RHOB|nr:serine hydrolase domain-containing protein [Paracoccus laeviglucosivorans]SMO74313.1 CubicO group peptidase, beta-lactamase class C family [Paracoccus laeviglucosivorans]
MTLAQMTEALDRGIDSALAEQRIVGCMVMLAQGGQTVFARAAGMADREAGRDMTPDTWLRYASVTKPLTTLAALRLMASGRLDAQDAVTRWLPEFTPALPDGTRPQITVDHLMSHMAGLDYTFAQGPGDPYPQAAVSDGISDSGITLAENVRRIASVPLDRVPGTAWRYSIATDVLGAVIEAAADMPLPDAMAALVTQPLQIDAAFQADPSRLAANYADAQPAPQRMQGLTRVPIPGVPNRWFSFQPERALDPAAYPSGGGGMAGTVPGALAALEALRSGNFIPDDLRRQAFANRIAEPHPMRGPGWGHSWAGAIVTDPGLAGVGLGADCISWGGIYGHSWIIDPSRDLILLSMTNTSTQGMNGAFAVEMASALMNR